MTAIEVLNKYGIRNDMAAKAIGISKSMFALKVKGYPWKPEEIQALNKYLADLAKDISKIK